MPDAPKASGARGWRVPSRLGPTRVAWWGACVLAAVLSGCGGSDFEPTVTSVRAVFLRYGQEATIQVGGFHLKNSMVIDAAPWCASPSFTGGSTPTLAVIRCAVAAVGEGTLTLRSDAGRVLYRTTLQVPLPQVQVRTTQGTITLELDPAKAPATVDNFLGYVAAGFYADTLIHRVIPGFVIQGGGFTGSFGEELRLKDGLRDAIALESANGLSNLRGTVAMARTSAPDSATSQFFVNLVDNLFLDRQDDASPGYAVFGQVVAGLEVVDAIATLSTGSSGSLQDVPTQDVRIEQVLRLR